MPEPRAGVPLRTASLIGAVVALLWTFCCLAIERRLGLPDPSVHDEFSYLLGADTFAHGRLANPPHPMGRFFESPHILVEPHYATKYPPGQSLVLAFGQIVFGHPYYAVVVSGAVMIFLFTVTLIAWTSIVPGTAVAIVFSLLFLPPMYWADSYWGGCVPAAGGALVLLAVELERRGRAIAAGLAFSAGVVILFDTRPYEGGVLTVAAVVASLVYLRPAKPRLPVFALAAAPVLVGALAWNAWYNASVTGDPFELPYVLHDARYDAAPLFWFRPPRPEPAYATPRLAALYSRHGEEFGIYLNIVRGSVFRPLVDAFSILYELLGAALPLAILLPFGWRDWRVRFAGAVLAVCLAGLWIETYHFPHYAAPMVLACALLAAGAVKDAWRFRLGAEPVGAILTCLAFAWAGWSPLRATVANIRSAPPRPPAFQTARADLVRRLTDVGNQHLVVVRYPDPAWRLVQEWVYNGAEIDSAPVVFAHDRGEKENQALFAYFNGRRRWLMTFNGDTMVFAPYPTPPNQ